jgi:hypothetical protein
MCPVVGMSAYGHFKKLKSPRVQLFPALKKRVLLINQRLMESANRSDLILLNLNRASKKVSMRGPVVKKEGFARPAIHPFLKTALS